MEFDIRVLYENLPRKFEFHQNLTRITGALHEDICKFMIIYGLIFIRIRKVSDKFVLKIKFPAK